MKRRSRHVPSLLLLALTFGACNRDDPTSVPAIAPRVDAPESAVLRDAIAFFTYEFSPNGNIAVMKSDGTDRRALPGGERGFEPSLSPDGRRVVFSRATTFPTSDIFVMNLDGSGATPLVQGLAFNGEPVWSPDGCRVAFRSVTGGQTGPVGRISIINADGTGLYQLTPEVGPDDFAFDEGASWSPDGTRLVFTRNLQLHLINADGTAMTPLPNEDMAQNPAWSPDGQQIAYFSLDPPGQIHVRNADGSNMRALTTGPDFDVWPRWSRDGGSLVFSRFSEGQARLFTINVDGSGLAALTPASVNDYMPDWSHAPATSRCNSGLTITINPSTPVLEPGATVQLTATVHSAGGTFEQIPVAWSSSDPAVATVTQAGLVTALTSGTAQILASAAGATKSITVTVREAVVLRNVIVYSTGEFGGIELALVNPDGSGRQRLTTNQFGYTAPDISPDGRRIVFAGLSGIYVMNADGSDITFVISRGSDQSPAWSPDGTQIAFTAESQGPDGFAWRIFVVNVDGTGLQQVSPDDPASFSDESPSWSPDGSKIVFTRDTRLMVINADGTDLTPLSADFALYPDWSPDGSRIVYSSFDVFYGIRIINADGSNSQTVMQSIDPIYTPRWSPDSRQMVYERIGAGVSQIHVMNADGSDDQMLLANPVMRAQQPTWSPLP